MQKWKRKVYHLPIRQKVRQDSAHWLVLRRKVFKRDKFQCQRCKKFFGEDGLQLQAHHIIPRPKGKTVPNNLVSLCNSCHDFVELNGFDFDMATEIKIEAKNRDWHKWVYGGYSKPSNQG